VSPRTATASAAEPAHDAVIDLACRALRLPTIRERCAEFAADATREHASYRAFLAALLTAECDDRDIRRRARGVADAGFPRPKRLEDFDFAANPNVAPALIGQLATAGWVAAGQPLCLIGDSGTGKTHLLIGLATAAAEAGHRVRYVTTAALVNELVEAADERRLSRTIARYGRVDLLCCDELGYLELDRRGAELLFQVFTEREERASVATASNAPFSEWVRTFTDARLPRRSSTGSPSTPTSFRPGPAATGSPTAGCNATNGRPRMRDALPPSPHGLARTGGYCEACGGLVVTAVETLFTNPRRGSSQRFCSPRCRQRAYRRRRAGVGETTPVQQAGGRGRRLGGGANSDRHGGATSS